MQEGSALLLPVLEQPQGGNRGSVGSMEAKKLNKVFKLTLLCLFCVFKPCSEVGNSEGLSLDVSKGLQGGRWEAALLLGQSRLGLGE